MQGKARGSAKFFSREVAEEAVGNVMLIMRKMREKLENKGYHIVIMVASPQGEPVILYECSEGDRVRWPQPFDKIAVDNAKSLLKTGEDELEDCASDLLFPGETPFWSGVKRRGFIVSCSGFQPWFNKLFAGMVADMTFALAYNNLYINAGKNQQ